MSKPRTIKILPGIPRYRSESNISNVYGRRTTTDATCAAPGTVESTPPFKAAKVGTTKSISDEVTPFFRERSARGDIIISPLSINSELHLASGDFGQAMSVAESCTTTHVHAYERWYGPWLHWLLAGQPVDGSVVPMGFLIAPSDIANAISVASTATWAKANAHNADILTDIAEMRQTLTMLRDPLKLTSRFLRNIISKRKGRSKLKGRDLIDYLNSQWLQYRYGIRPLVNSVQGVLKSLNETHGKRRSTYRGSYSLWSSSVTAGTRVGSVLTHDYQFSYTDHYSVRAGMLIEDTVSMADSLGVDASGMLALPWELVPYSFVADWFANTSSFLNALVPYLSKRPLGSWFTEVRTRTVEFKATDTRATSPTTYTVIKKSDEVRNAEYITKTRHVGLPSPSLAWKPQSISKVFDDLRIADAFSLVANLFFSAFKG